MVPEEEPDDGIYKVAEKITQIENYGKFDRNNCLAVVDVWDVYSRVSFQDLSTYKQLFKRLVKVISKTILGGLWEDLWKEGCHARLIENITTIQTAIQETPELIHEYKQCLTIHSLLKAAPEARWQKPSVTNILHPPPAAEDIQKIANVGVLLEEEGWLFLESRIEILCGSAFLINFAEGCILKAESLLSTGLCSNSSSDYDISLDKYYQFLSIFTVAILTMKEKNAKLSQRLESLLKPSKVMVEIVNKLIHKQNPTRLNWKAWKKKEEIAYEILESKLMELNTTGIESTSEVKVLFHSWLCLQLKKKERFHELPIPLTSTILLNDVEELNIVLPEKLKDLLEKASKNEFVYAYADSIVEIFGLNQSTLPKCLELYLSRLSPDVSTFTDLLYEETAKEHLSILSQGLAIAFKSLSPHFILQPQVHFEVLLTSFSLDPSREILNQLRRMVEEEGVDLRTKLSKIHNENIGLPTDLYLDFMNCVHGARFHRLTCFRESWDTFGQVCEKHLKTKGNDIKGVADLELAKPTDFSIYAGLKKAYDENDAGYEAGYLPDPGAMEEESEEEEDKRKKKKNRIREPFHRMATLMRHRVAALKKAQKMANPSIFARKRKQKILDGLPRKKFKVCKNESKPSSTAGTDGVDQNQRSEPELNGNENVKKKRRKRVLKVQNPDTKNRVSSFIRELRTRVQKPIQISPEKSSQEGDEELSEEGSDPDYGKKAQKSNSRVKRKLHFSTPTRRNSTNDEDSEFTKSLGKPYKPNDNTVNTVQLNQKYCLKKGQSGVWPDMNYATPSTTQSNVVCFPLFEPYFPLPGTVGTSMPYHQSSTTYHVTRSGKTSSTEEVHKLSSRFTPVAELVLQPTEYEYPTPTSFYLNNPQMWITYINTPTDLSTQHQSSLNSNDNDPLTTELSSEVPIEIDPSPAEKELIRSEAQTLDLPAISSVSDEEIILPTSEDSPHTSTTSSPNFEPSELNSEIPNNPPVEELLEFDSKPMEEIIQNDETEKIPDGSNEDIQVQSSDVPSISANEEKVLPIPTSPKIDLKHNPAVALNSESNSTDPSQLSGTSKEPSELNDISELNSEIRPNSSPLPPVEELLESDSKPVEEIIQREEIVKILILDGSHHTFEDIQIQTLEVSQVSVSDEEVLLLLSTKALNDTNNISSSNIDGNLELIATVAINSESAESSCVPVTPINPELNSEIPNNSPLFQEVIEIESSPDEINQNDENETEHKKSGKEYLECCVKVTRCEDDMNIPNNPMKIDEIKSEDLDKDVDYIPSESESESSEDESPNYEPLSPCNSATRRLRNRKTLKPPPRIRNTSTVPVIDKPKPKMAKVIMKKPLTNGSSQKSNINSIHTKKIPIEKIKSEQSTRLAARLERRRQPQPSSTPTFRHILPKPIVVQIPNTHKFEDKPSVKNEEEDDIEEEDDDNKIQIDPLAIDPSLLKSLKPMTPETVDLVSTSEDEEEEINHEVIISDLPSVSPEAFRCPTVSSEGDCFENPPESLRCPTVSSEGDCFEDPPSLHHFDELSGIEDENESPPNIPCYINN